MKPSRVLTPAVVLLALAPAAWAVQPSLSGFLAFDYVWPRSGVGQGNFQNLQGGLKATGEFMSRVQFAFELRLAAETLVPDQAWASYTFSDMLTVKAGLGLVPFGQSNRASLPFETLYIQRPLNLEETYPSRWRDIGLTGEGRWGFLSYAAYLGNGLAEGEGPVGVQQFRDNNRSLAGGGRLGLHTSETVELGASYYRGAYDDEGRRHLTLAGADISWLAQSWSLLAEYTKATRENPAPLEDGTSEGTFVLLLLNLGRLQPIGTYQASKTEDPYHVAGAPGDGEATGFFRDRTRWTAGLRLIVGAGLFLKGEYAVEKDRDLGRTDRSFRIQAALSF